MFWKIVGLTVSWIGTFVIVNVFGPRFNLVFAVPAYLTLLFVYHGFVKKINFFEVKRGWILVISILCEIGILALVSRNNNRVWRDRNYSRCRILFDLFLVGA